MPADWPGLLEHMELAVTQFACYLRDGTGAALECAETALRAALAKHAEVVSAIRGADEPWNVAQAALLAEAEHLLDDLSRALQKDPTIDQVVSD